MLNSSESMIYCMSKCSLTHYFTCSLVLRVSVKHFCINFFIKVREKKIMASHKQNSFAFFIYPVLLIMIILIVMVNVSLCGWRRDEDKSKCPKVKEITNFDISEFLGSWYIVQYYASSEEALAYKCMRAELSLSEDKAEVTMNFTYSFVDDPINEKIIGNITWEIPNYYESPAHWIHAEFPYEGIYNTYVLDTDYKSWALLMHCAEQNKIPRYLSSFIMSRKKNLGPNFVSYLRDKLPRYDINVEYMFPMEQKNCKMSDGDALMVLPVIAAKKAYAARRHSRQLND